MSKRYFRIDTGRYGGEVVVGKVTKDFVQYWQERDSDDLISHIYNVDWSDEDIDSNSPLMTSDGNVCWHEIDDYEHANGPYSDNSYLVYEIRLADGVTYQDGELIAPPDWDMGTSLYEEIADYETYGYSNFVYGREAYTSESDEFVPVLQFHSAEKGSFGEIFIETDGEDFDPTMLSVGTVETDICEIIEAYWYKDKPLYPNFDYCDSIGKSTYVSLAYLNEKMWKKEFDFCKNIKESVT